MITIGALSQLWQSERDRLLVGICKVVSSDGLQTTRIWYMQAEIWITVCSKPLSKQLVACTLAHRQACKRSACLGILCSCWDAAAQRLLLCSNLPCSWAFARPRLFRVCPGA